MESLEDKIQFNQETPTNQEDEQKIQEQSNEEQQNEQEQIKEESKNNIEENTVNQSTETPLPTLSEAIIHSEPQTLIKEDTSFIENSSINKEQSEIENLIISKEKANLLMKTDIQESIKIFNESLNKTIQLISNNNSSPKLIELEYHFLNNLAICYILTQQYSKAIEIDNQIILEKLPKESSLLRLFKSHKELGQIDKAIQYSQDIKRDISPNILQQNQGIMDEIEELINPTKPEKDLTEKNKNEGNMMKNVFMYSLPVIAVISVGLFWFYKKKN